MSIQFRAQPTLSPYERHIAKKGGTPTANTDSAKIKIPAPLENRTTDIQSTSSNYTELPQVPIQNCNEFKPIAIANVTNFINIP